MKKDKKFLGELEKNLVGIKDKYKKEIISKYENIIKEEKAKNKKITVILREIGTPVEIANKEMEALGNKGKLSIFDKLSNKLSENREKRKIKREEKAAKKESERLKKNGIKVSVNNKKFKPINKNKKEDKKDKGEILNILKIRKPKNEEVKKEDKKKDSKKKEEVKEDKKKKETKIKDKKEKKEKKNKVSFKERFAKFKEAITKDIKFTKKEKPAKKRKVEETPKEIVTEIKEEIKEEISEASEVVSEAPIFESKEKRRKRIILSTLGIILTTLLLFVWLWVSVLFVASLVAYLDGVKFTGLIIGLFGLDFLVLWIVVMTNRAIFKHKMSLRLNLIVCFLSIAIIAVGVVLALRQIYKIEMVEDVSVKYSMTTKLNNYDLPDEKEKKFNLTFNSNYKTQYTINYDEMIKDKVRVEVKYYECYYDFYEKKVTNGAYISLATDDRDRLSVYIDDLKEGLVFSNDELSRYTIKISVNPNDADRINIMD